MKELDAYITGQNIHYGEMVLHKCPHCQSIKELPMFYEWGGWFYSNDADVFCDYCLVDDGVCMQSMSPLEEKQFQFNREAGKYSDNIVKGYFVWV